MFRYLERAAQAALSTSSGGAAAGRQRQSGRWIAAVTAGLVLLGAGSSVSAHGEAYLVVEPMTISPNGEGSVRGAGFGAAEIVTLVLVTSTGEVPLGSVEADGEGSFDTVIRLPSDAAGGGARLEARASDHTESVAITVAGAVPDDEGEGRRDEEEPLLAPVSSTPISSGTTEGAPAVPRASSVPAPSATTTAAPGQAILVGVGIALLAAALGGALAVRRRRGRRAAGPGGSSA